MEEEIEERDKKEEREIEGEEVQDKKKSSDLKIVADRWEKKNYGRKYILYRKGKREFWFLLESSS